MGVIFRQSIKYTVVSYFGVLIGIFSALFIFPQEEEIYGFFQLFIQGGTLLMSLFIAGFNIHAVRFFPDFESPEKKHNGFLSFLLIGGSLGFLIFLISLPLIQYLTVDVMFAKSASRELFADHFYYLIPLVLLLIFNTILSRYISNFHRIVVPQILNDLLLKLSLPVYILLFHFEYIGLNLFVLLILLNYTIVFTGLLLYLKTLGQFSLKLDLKFITKPLRKKIIDYSVFGLLNVLGTRLVVSIDIIMVSAMFSVELGGAYAIIRVMSEVISKPTSAILSIASPIISKYLNQENMVEIHKVYKKSSDTLLLASTLLFLLLWLSIEDVFQLMPRSYAVEVGTYVFLFLGIAKILDAGTSVNDAIIGYSKYFRFNLYSILLLAALNIVFNLIFIEKFGVVGAAIATMCSLFIFNLGKFLFIWIKFGIQPFSKKTLLIVILAAVCYVSFAFIPLHFHPIVNVILRSSGIALVYLVAAYRLSLSVEMNQFLNKYLKRNKMNS